MKFCLCVNSWVDGFFDQCVGCVGFTFEYFLVDPVKWVVFLPAVISDFVLFGVTVLNSSLVLVASSKDYPDQKIQYPHQNLPQHKCLRRGPPPTCLVSKKPPTPFHHAWRWGKCLPKCHKISILSGSRHDKTNKILYMNLNVTCVMRVMSVSHADTYTSVLRSTKEESMASASWITTTEQLTIFTNNLRLCDAARTNWNDSFMRCSLYTS